MVQEDTVAEFPVVLYNGERQVNIGKIDIHPTIHFQDFRTMVKQMTGISYNNLTTYLVQSRKILITRKVDFTVLMKQKNAYFLVVLKRSRRDRRRKSYRQNSPKDLFDYDYSDRCSKVEYWLHELEIEKEKYNNMNLMHDQYDVGSNYANFPSIMETVESVETRAMCEDCMHANKPEFHLCVYDEVVAGFFRSPAGPICRPM